MLAGSWGSAPGIWCPFPPQDLRFAPVAEHSAGGVSAAARWGGPSRRLVPNVFAAMTQPGTRLSDRSEAEVLRPKRTQDAGDGASEAGEGYRDLSKILPV